MRANDARKIAIVSGNAETRNGLEGYLRNVGIPAESRHVFDVSDLHSDHVRALVLFPDDFDQARVQAGLGALLALAREARPPVLVVTRNLVPYETVLGGRPDFIVLARPAWGWALVDAIRGYEAARAARGRRKESGA